MSKQNTKYFLKLYNEYDKYMDEKKSYLNYKRIIEYLFNKPLQKIYTLNELIIFNKIYYDDNKDNNSESLKIIRLELSNDDKIGNHIFALNSLHQMYSSTMEYIKKYNDKNKIRKTNLKAEISENERKIMKYMDVLTKKYEGKIEYTYNWNFNVIGENNSVMKIPTVNYQDNYNYSFYGVIMFKHHLIQFIIMYDDEIHFDRTDVNFTSIHRRDIINQYMLFQMNVNLLRLNKNNFKMEHDDYPHSSERQGCQTRVWTYKIEIKNFINRIKHTTEYVIQNGIIPIVKLFKSTEINSTLKNFCDDYEYNRIIYHKLPKKIHYDYKTNEDKFYEYLTTKDIYTDEEQDECKKITREAIKKIIKSERIYEPQETGNKRKAEEYIVNLYKANREDEMDEDDIKKVIKYITDELNEDVELVEEERSEDDVKKLLRGLKKSNIKK